jgi:hypothetical protein
LYPQIVGQEINAAGNFFELGNNALVRYRCRKDKVDPKQAVIRAKLLLSRIDVGLQERSASISESTDIERAAYEAEGSVLFDLRNILVNEFRKVYVNARKEFAWQNTFEIIDLTRNTVGAIGNQLSVRAGYTGNSHLNGIGNLLSAIAAAGITVSPSLSAMISNANKDLAEKRLNKEFPDAGNSGNLEVDLRRLKEVEDSASESGMRGRALAVSECAQLVTSGQLLRQRNEEASKKRIELQFIRSTGYGPTKLANSVLGMVDGFNRHLDPTLKNRLAAAGNLTYTTGQGINFIELWRERISDEVEEHRLQREGNSTTQLLRARLATLEELNPKLK